MGILQLHIWPREKKSWSPGSTISLAKRVDQNPESGLAIQNRVKHIQARVMEEFPGDDQKGITNPATTFSDRQSINNLSMIYQHRRVGNDPQNQLRQTILLHLLNNCKLCSVKF